MRGFEKPETSRQGRVGNSANDQSAKGSACRIGFQRVVRILRHHGTAMRLQVDQAARRQHPERIPDMATRCVRGLGEVGLGQTVSTTQLAGDDVLMQRRNDGVRDDLTRGQGWWRGQ